MKRELVDGNIEEGVLDTPLGKAHIFGNEDGVEEIKIIEEGDERQNLTLTAQPVITCVKELKAYFEEGLKEFSFPLCPKGTDFQKRVWKILEEIPYGKTITYLEQAQRLGDVKAIRAVASANGRNPLWVVVPCHRVVGSDGSLTGYAGGIWRKKWLLKHEGALRQMELF